MALAILAELPELTREQYELVAKKVNEAGTPAGALVHAGGPVEGATGPSRCGRRRRQLTPSMVRTGTGKPSPRSPASRGS